MLGKQVTDNKFWRIMLNYQENPENLEDSNESFPEEVNPEEVSSDSLFNSNEVINVGRITSDDGLTEKENVNYANNDEVLNEIERVFREDKMLMTKLIKKAEVLLSTLTNNNKINGLEAGDLVMESISAILSLDRKWYKERCPNIVVLIIGVITSKIKNIVNGKNFKYENKIIPLFQNDENDNYPNSVYDDELGKSFNKADFEFENDGEEIINNILKLFEDDIEAYCLIDELIRTEDYNVKEQNQLLSKQLGISVRDVENAKKRIKYKLSVIKRTNE